MHSERRALLRALSCAAAAAAAIGCDLLQPSATAPIDGEWKFDAVQSCATGAPCLQTHGSLTLTENTGTLTGVAHLAGEPGLAADTTLVGGYRQGASIGFFIATCNLVGMVYNDSGTFMRGDYHCGAVAGTWNAVRPQTAS